MYPLLEPQVYYSIEQECFKYDVVTIFFEKKRTLINLEYHHRDVQKGPEQKPSAGGIFLTLKIMLCSKDSWTQYSVLPEAAACVSCLYFSGPSLADRDVSGNSTVFTGYRMSILSQIGFFNAFLA